MARLFAMALSACTWGRDVRVPDHRASESAPSGPETASSPIEPTTLEIRALSSPTEVPSLDGAAIRGIRGQPRALAIQDFDRDGDRDAILVSVDGREVVLALVRNDGVASEPRLLPTRVRAPADSRCVPSVVSMRSLTREIVEVRAEASCEGLGERHELLWAIELEREPRVVVAFELGRGAAGEAMSLRAEDHDGDGHDDLSLGLTLLIDGEAVTLSLRWLSRAAGLVRAEEEPESTFASLASRAQGRLRRDPAQAAARAARVLALRDALCADGASPRFWVDGAAASACGSSPATTKAMAVRAAGLARGLRVARGQIDPAGLDDAVQALVRFERARTAPRPADRRAVLDAWARIAVPFPNEPRRLEGISLAPSSSPWRLSTLAFVGDDALVVRGSTPRILDVSDGTGRGDVEAVDLDGRIRDTTRRFVLASVEERCASRVLVFEALGAPRREVLIDPDPERGCGSAASRMAISSDATSFVLGWAPQGLVLTAGRSLEIVPLDAEARLLGSPRLLEDVDPTPAPIAPGAALSDGSAHALALSVGLLVVDRIARTARLFRWGATSAPSGAPIDVALSPSRNRAAWLCSSAVCVADLPESPATAQ